MLTEELITYIRQLRKASYASSDVRAWLIQNGWNPTDVETGFQEAKRRDRTGALRLAIGTLVGSLVLFSISVMAGLGACGVTNLTTCVNRVEVTVTDLLK